MSRIDDVERSIDVSASRRSFLKAGVALAGATALPLSACKATSVPPVAGAGDSPPPFALDETTLADLESALTSGEHTAATLTALYRDRIAAVDRAGPTINSVIELNPEADRIAEELDRERRGGKARGRLHGIPVLIKDNIDTADQMRTSAGSLALADSRAPADAGLVRRLRAAGAVILGKTNLSEWANIRSSRSTSGWSARGGLTRNPYALDRNPCGSSSGTGAAIAANLAAVGVGTETDGSIVCPSHANGLVGIKPTVGLVSRAGIIPISHSQDTAGPMCRTVRDAAVLLTAMAGADGGDPATAASAGRIDTDYARHCDAGGLKGAKIGVLRDLFNAGPQVDRVMEGALAALREAGATLIDPVKLSSLGPLGDAELVVLLTELKAGLGAYFATLGPSSPMKSLADVIAFNRANATHEMPHFGQELFEQAELKGSLTSVEYRRALATCRRLSRVEGLDALFARHGVEALVAPTGGPAWVTDLVNGDHFGGGSSTLCAVAGYPNITVPAGEVSGLPIGLSFMGRAWSEGTLIRLAYAFEQSTKARAAPMFLATVPPRPLA
jgi:amidase